MIFSNPTKKNFNERTKPPFPKEPTNHSMTDRSERKIMKNHPPKIMLLCAVGATMAITLRQLYEHLEQAGYDVVGLCSTAGYEDQFAAENKRVINTKISRSIRSALNPITILRLRKIIRRERPDIVHVHTPVAALLGRVAAKLAGVKTVIYTVHGFHFHERVSHLKYWILSAVEKIWARLFTDQLWFVSAEDYALAKRRKFKRADRLILISNSVDAENRFNSDHYVDAAPAIRTELGLSETDRTIAFAGRLVREKGILDLLEAHRRLGRPDVHLLIAGTAAESERDGLSENELAPYRTPNVHFLGFVGDMERILAVTDIFVLPSYREGFPVCTLEAMSMDCATIVTNIRGSREQIEDGMNGLIYPPGNVEALEHALRRLLGDNALLQQLQAAARQTILEKYNERIIMQQQMKLYQQEVQLP